MKIRKLFSFLLLLSVGAPALAQHSLMGGGRVGGYIGPVLKVSAVDGTPSVFVGGRAGMAIPLDSANTLAVGGGMYGLMTSIEGPVRETGAQDLRFGYGGLELEYVLHPNSLAHFSVSTLLGFGRAAYETNDNYYGGHGSGHMWGDGPAFFVAEPGGGLTLNVTPFLQLGLGAGYHFVGAGRGEEVRSVELSGPTGMFSILLGRHHM